MKKRIKQLYKGCSLFVFIVLLCSCGLPEDKEEYEQEIIPVYAPVETPTITLTAKPTEPVKNEPIEPTEIPTKPIKEPVSTCSPTPVAVNPLDGAYWRERYVDATAELMTKKEIASVNEKNFRADGTNLVKLSEWEKTETAKVLQMLTSYSFPKLKYYDNREITSADKETICNARNMEALQRAERVDPTYGILIRNTNLRSFPTEKCLTTTMNGRYDYLQETVLLLNEAVVVLHTSLDGEWCFVQAENYYGWISEDAIAYCSKEDMIEWYGTMWDTESHAFLLVTKNGVYETEEEPLALRMGTRFSYEEREDGEIVIVLPTRDEDKNLKKKRYVVKTYTDEFEKSFHRGYVPYTRSNIVALTTELLDTPYAWGDAFSYEPEGVAGYTIGMDCSSTVAAVYRCFGFVLPRNTGAQRNMACDGYDMTEESLAARSKILDELEAGALLYSPGHVMVYLGKVDDEYYVLHNTTTEFLPDGTEEAFYRCVITTMSLGKSGETIENQLVAVKVLE